MNNDSRDFVLYMQTQFTPGLKFVTCFSHEMTIQLITNPTFWNPSGPFPHDQIVDWTDSTYARHRSIRTRTHCIIDDVMYYAIYSAIQLHEEIHDSSTLQSFPIPTYSSCMTTLIISLWIGLRLNATLPIQAAVLWGPTSLVNELSMRLPETMLHEPLDLLKK